MVIIVFNLGNENIYSLTTNGERYKLRVDLADFNGNARYAEYSDFKLGAPWEKYKLVSLGNYSGDAGEWIVIYTADSFIENVSPVSLLIMECLIHFRLIGVTSINSVCYMQ